MGFCFLRRLVLPHRRVSRRSLLSVVKAGILPRNQLALSAAGSASLISIGAATAEAQKRIGAEIVEIIKNF